MCKEPLSRLIAGLVAAALLAYGCFPNQADGGRDFPYGEMSVGDLAFRCGRGMFSHVVTISEDRGLYSHVGVIVNDGGVWKVAHAVPDEKEFKGDFDRVKLEDLDVYFSGRRARRGCLVHTGLTDSSLLGSLGQAAIKAFRDSVEFDNDYNLVDSCKVYCTEFVWRLFRDKGLDLSEGRRLNAHIMHIDGEVLLPEHLLDYSGNKVYYSF
ncbi:MAG: hypothetical protein II102_03305 [Bacteroidales bacterium]|nr:hypothetical protein [Bacteroidales bacterium]